MLYKGQNCKGSNVIVQEGEVLITDPAHLTQGFNTCCVSIGAVFLHM